MTRKKKKAKRFEIGFYWNKKIGARILWLKIAVLAIVIKNGIHINHYLNLEFYTHFSWISFIFILFYFAILMPKL
ncbi:unnamed protein product [Blepharisma stoltei]|uniref:Uncharacterized protein n=1 Tax=Blepharisma stoltei TaxID=1481888 RepID=A0AAU9JHD5_9CILI|nr:unnamed protein product [Blepharisma stoltei]